MKKQPMYKRYENIKPVGVASVSSVFGIHVYEPDKNDKYDCDYIVSWHNGENEWGYHKHKVHYTSSGRAYIRKGSLTIYCDEIMKI